MSKTESALNADQCAHLMEALERFGDIHMYGLQKPRISAIKACAKSAFIIELCEILGLELDEGAKHNATPLDLRPFKGDCTNVA
jgi:hypothetical protein